MFVLRMLFSFVKSKRKGIAPALFLMFTQKSLLLIDRSAVSSSIAVLQNRQAT